MEPHLPPEPAVRPARPWGCDGCPGIREELCDMDPGELATVALQRFCCQSHLS